MPSSLFCTSVICAYNLLQGAIFDFKVLILAAKIWLFSFIPKFFPVFLEDYSIKGTFEGAKKKNISANLRILAISSVFERKFGG
jgi:hypothetical protein